MKSLKFETVTTMDVEGISTMDGGYFKEFIPNELHSEEMDPVMYFRICSYDNSKKHHKFNKLMGRKIKITVETVD